METQNTDSILVGSLVISSESSPPDIRSIEVAEKFFASPKLDALAVVESNKPIALVTRLKIFFTLFRRYGFEVFGKRPIITIADTDPLIVKEKEPLSKVIDKALERPTDKIYDEIIVVDENGYYKGIVSVKQMILQQSQALANSIVQKELAHERAKELEKTNKIKSQFIANVTHELRSPVNAIMGLVELMRIACDKGDISQLKDRITLLMSTATNLRAIITNILDLSKIEAGKMEVFYEDFNVVLLLREVAETTRVLLGNKPVEVEVIAHEGPIFINSDPVKLRQILTNLTSNAAKFTEKGKIMLGIDKGEDKIKIYVKDTGIGIKDEDLDKLFIAFNQLEDAKTKRHEGTGLGLTITKNLVNLLGGKITLSSKFGVGTTFEVTLPIHRDNNK